MMNKLDMKNENIVIHKDSSEVKYYFDTNDKNVVYHVLKGAKLVIYQYSVNINFNVTIYLDEEDAEVEYHYSTINYDNHKFNISVIHKANNTVSHVYNHGLNVFNNSLVFDVVGEVQRKKDDCVCNQENQIINLENGDSTILPKLLIDHYNVSSLHSAYIGKFKEDVLFYLMSRGLSRKKSYELLIKSFLLNSSIDDNKEVKLMLDEIKKI